MVKVEVHFIAQLAEELGVRKLALYTPHTLSEAVCAIEKATGYPLGSKLGSGYGLLVNGRSHLLLSKENYLLKDGDIIAILPILGGG